MKTIAEAYVSIYNEIASNYPSDEHFDYNHIKFLAESIAQAADSKDSDVIKSSVENLYEHIFKRKPTHAPSEKHKDRFGLKFPQDEDGSPV